MIGTCPTHGLTVGVCGLCGPATTVTALPAQKPDRDKIATDVSVLFESEEACAMAWLLIHRSKPPWNFDRVKSIYRKHGWEI